MCPLSHSSKINKKTNNYDTKQLIKEVLEKGFVMSLGTVDDGGVWVADVIYIHDDDFNIYWISDPECRHSKAIDRQNKVAITITAKEQVGNELGLQVEGIASKIEGSLFELERQHQIKRNKPIPTKPGEVLEGDSWYVLKPTKIEVLNTELFGYDKVALEL